MAKTQEGQLRTFQVELCQSDVDIATAAHAHTFLQISKHSVLCGLLRLGPSPAVSFAAIRQ